MTWLPTCLSTWLMTSALPEPILARPGQRVEPNRSTGSTQTRSTVNRVNPTRSTGQWANPVNRVNPDKPDPVNTAQPCARAATRFPTRRPFWWRVRAREREFLGNFGTYRFVSKFPTIWYIDLACLKLLKT